jgi:tRNA (adenine22-N1)-methyltransferase
MLNRRLSACLPYLKGFNVLYDIGTDHAYFPISAIKENLIKKAYAIDNKIGPLSLAKQNIVQHELETFITPILSSGIDALTQDVDVIMMAGLGGNLIYETFVNKRLPHVKRLILQPNNNAQKVRALTKDGFKIIDEMIIEEASERYIIIVLEPGTMHYDEKALRFGPILLKQKSPIYKAMLEDELNHYIRILAQVPKDNPNRKLEQEIKAIKEVLYEWTKY